MHLTTCGDAVPFVKKNLKVRLSERTTAADNAQATRHSSRRVFVFLLLPIAAVVTGCVPALKLPDDFWKTVALADKDAQEAQGKARILALMHLETTKPDVRALLKGATQPVPQLPPVPAPPTPPLPPTKADDPKQRADYDKKLAEFQAAQGTVTKRLQDIFDKQQEAMLKAAEDDFDVKQASIGIFLSDDDYRLAAEAYESARERWNSLYDTVSTIIGTNRDIPDWPDFRLIVETADKETQTFFARYQSAKENTPKNRDAYVRQADARPGETVARLAEARERLVAAMRRVNPGAMAVAPTITPFSASSTSTPPPASPGFSWVGSPLISGGIDLVTIFKEVGNLHERERSFLQTQLQARKWPTIECLGQPEGAGCSTGGQNKPTTPPKTTDGTKSGGTP